jgi:hypothetical protein
VMIAILSDALGLVSQISPTGSGQTSILLLI